MDENELSHVIIGAAIEVHKYLGGPGLLEGVYAEALASELRLRDVPVETELKLPIVYKGQILKKYCRLDLLVNRLVIVEAKAVEKFHDVHLAQCLTHLRITNKRLGLVINFGETYVKNGVHRVVNGL